MAERPIRVQLSRAKGWRMPPNTVKVSRPGVFGNPFTMKFVGDWYGIPHSAARAKAVELYRAWIAGALDENWEAKPPTVETITTLRGKNLACWCPLGSPCHADVLLDLANAPVCEEAA